MKTDFMQLVTANLGQSRRETLHGRDYIVAPATLIVGDSVLNGSQGPLFYPKSEVTARPDDWNGMPLVAYHPTKPDPNRPGHSLNVSARDPEVLNEWGLGHFYAANADDGDLRGEAWFDVLNVKAVDERLKARGVRNLILPRLLSNKPVELSTGLFTENVPAPKGAMTDNGVPYSATATQYRPDHVAILPDDIGACSVKDGCGVNNQVVNTWSDAAREAAAAARKAASTVRTADKVIKRYTNIARDASLSAERKSVTASDRLSHEDAGQAHKEAARMHGSAAITQERGGNRQGSEAHLKAQEAHKQAAEFHIQHATTLNQSATCNCGPNCDCQECKDEWSGADKTFEGWLTGNESTLPLFGIDSDKACEILKDGTVGGNPLTEAQRGMFGAACGRTKNKRTNTITNRRRRPMTKTQRQALIKDLTTNCSCHKGKAKTLNLLDDDQLEAVANSSKIMLVVNQLKANKGKFAFNADGEGEGEAAPGVPWTKLASLLGIDIDPREDPVAFSSALKTAAAGIVSKLGGEAAPPPPPDDMVENPDDMETNIDAGDDCTGDDQDDECRAAFAHMDNPTGNKKGANMRRTINEADLPASVREDLAFARQVRNQRKQEIVRELIADVPTANKKTVGDMLYKKPLSELETLKVLRPSRVANQAPAEPTINWALAGGGSPVVNGFDSQANDEEIELMTMNCGRMPVAQSA